MSNFPTAPLVISKIRTDGGTQPRAQCNDSVIEEYAEAMRNRAQFPPVTVFHDGTDFWLADGFHRIAAAEKAGLARIDASLRPGSLEQAQLYSYSVNRTHGLRRTNEDKRRVVAATLVHSLSSEWGDRAIAEHCGVDDKMVATLRAEFVSTGSKSQSTVRIGKDGRAYDIAKIQEANKARTTTTTTVTTTQVVESTEEIPDVPNVETYQDLESATVYELKNDEDVTETVKDKLGHPVPEQQAIAFLELPPVLGHIRSCLIAAQKVWNDFQAKIDASHEWQRALSGSPSVQHVQEEIRKLGFATNFIGKCAPYSLCLYCKLREPECRVCHGAGWIDEESYGHAPKDLGDNETFAEYQRRKNITAQ